MVVLEIQIYRLKIYFLTTLDTRGYMSLHPIERYFLENNTDHVKIVFKYFSRTFLNKYNYFFFQLTNK